MARAQLVYKRSILNASVQIMDEYLSPAVIAAFTDAGWTDQHARIPRLRELYDGAVTHEFSPPNGSEIFGGHTKEEGQRNNRVARSILRQHGIALLGQHKLTFAEQV
jgi:hypothetical protein